LVEQVIEEFSNSAIFFLSTRPSQEHPQGFLTISAAAQIAQPKDQLPILGPRRQLRFGGPATFQFGLKLLQRCRVRLGRNIPERDLEQPLQVIERQLARLVGDPFEDRLVNSFEAR
jgi:hypothetical protein